MLAYSKIIAKNHCYIYVVLPGDRNSIANMIVIIFEETDWQLYA